MDCKKKPEHFVNVYEDGWQESLSCTFVALYSTHIHPVYAKQMNLLKEDRLIRQKRLLGLNQIAD